MSILIVQATSGGLIFGADRNVTEIRHAGPLTLIHGQTPRAKVLRWPNRKALVGYVGESTIGGQWTDEWLMDFIGRNHEFQSFEVLAERLREEVQAQRRIDEGSDGPSPILIHLAGFERRNSAWVPVVWFVRNVYGLDEMTEEYKDFRKEYHTSEELHLPGRFGEYDPEEVRDALRSVEERRGFPFWFHQGLDLGVFNRLEGAIKRGFVAIWKWQQLLPTDKRDPDLARPQTLSDWEKYVGIAILTYGDFFQTFKGPGEHYVGGGVDAFSLRWPTDAQP